MSDLGTALVGIVLGIDKLGAPRVQSLAERMRAEFPGSSTSDKVVRGLADFGDHATESASRAWAVTQAKRAANARNAGFGTRVLPSIMGKALRLLLRR